jgi:hypothetical protein
MHISHRPLLAVWTPSELAPKAAPDSTKFVEIARIAEDLGEGAKRGRFIRPRRARVRQPRNEVAAVDSDVENSSDIAKWSPASIATFDLTTIGATNAEPYADSPKDAGNLRMDASETSFRLMICSPGSSLPTDDF